MPRTAAAKPSKSAAVQPPQYQPTGIPQLDDILHGGFPRGATVLLAGAAGTGKTILATQWLFAGYQQYGEPGIFISMTEPVAKYLHNAAQMSFFRQDQVNPLQVYFTDLRAVIRGLDMDARDFSRKDVAKIVDVIRNMVLQSGAKRVVLDSVTAIAYRLRDRDLIRDFIFSLGTMLGQLDANVLLTSEVGGEGYGVFGVEEFICDGILKLSYMAAAEERIRQLEIVKMRGTGFNPHPAAFRLGIEGVVLFPYQHRTLPSLVSQEKISTGIVGLDAMSQGGYFEGSATLLTGASGTGKTATALHLIAQALRSGRRCLYVSLEESRAQLFKNASTLGWDFESHEKKGLLRLIAVHPEQRYLDEHVIEIEKAIETHRSTIVVIDSLTALGNVYPEPLVRDFAARLVTICKARLVTSLFTHASEALMGASGISEAHLSSLFDNIIMLRFVEVRSALHRGMLIVKMRGSAHDAALREFVFIGGEGIRISTDFSGYEGVMRGEARKTSETIEERLRGLLVGVFGTRGEAILAREKARGLTLENTRELLKELSDQGVLSMRKKRDFLNELEMAAGRE